MRRRGRSSGGTPGVKRTFVTLVVTACERDGALALQQLTKNHPVFDDAIVASVMRCLVTERSKIVPEAASNEVDVNRTALQERDARDRALPRCTDACTPAGPPRAVGARRCCDHVLRYHPRIGDAVVRVDEHSSIPRFLAPAGHFRDPTRVRVPWHVFRLRARRVHRDLRGVVPNPRSPSHTIRAVPGGQAANRVPTEATAAAESVSPARATRETRSASAPVATAIASPTTARTVPGSSSWEVLAADAVGPGRDRARRPRLRYAAAPRVTGTARSRRRARTPQADGRTASSRRVPCSAAPARGR